MSSESHRARLLAILGQMEQTEWFSRAGMERRQFDTLGSVLRHAAGTVPFYRESPTVLALAHRASLDAAAWAELPVLTRADVQAAGDSLVSTSIPPDHLPLNEMVSSGSTGTPLRAVTTAPAQLVWLAITLRDHLWQRRDFRATMAYIRMDGSGSLPREGMVRANWGTPVATVADTGPSGLLSIQRDIPEQTEWLLELNPDYLLTMPSNLLALARHFRAHDLTLPRLRQARTMGELLGPEVRPACREAWGVPVTDIYSASEVGYIALQCPTGEQYHVQSEGVYVEVLDERGDPCRPGQTGRVVVSTLHNFAMPLLRYDMGDYAEVGVPCACGRGLPVLAHIVGRQRNLMALPNGERVMPVFGEAWRGIDAIRQIQLAQHSLDRFEARIVASRPLIPEEEGRFAATLQRTLGFPFDVQFTYLDRIDRDEMLKFEDFVCLLPQAGP